MRIVPLATTALLLASVVACGTKLDTPTSDTTDQRFDPIVGGKIDNDMGHDGVVLLHNADDGGMCTGAIISQPGETGVVLTARHCVSKVKQEYVTCKDDVAGDSDPNLIYVLRGTKPMVHQKLLGRGKKLFHPGGTSLCNADIAVMVLDEPIDGVEPLRVRIDKAAYHVGEKFTAIGYGLTNPNDYSAGERYLREDVEVTDLGPQYYGLYDKEFLGTTSICSGDSGGPAVSESFAVMGVTSRGGNCFGNDNIWTRPDGFRDLMDDAMAYAGSSYMDENGTIHGEPGGTGGAGGAGGMAGAGGDAGAGGAGISGSAGAAGQAPGTEPEPARSCGDHGPCPPDTTCVVDPATGDPMCGTTCNASNPCPEGAFCHPSLGVCVQDANTDPAVSQADGDARSDGSCSVSAPISEGSAGVAAALAGLIATMMLRRRRHAGLH